MTENTKAIEADSGMSGEAVERAERTWANLPTGCKWTSLATHEKALVCHTLAALQGQATGDRDGVEKRAFIAGYRAAHMVPDAYDSTSAAEEAWEGYRLVSDALTTGGHDD